MKPDTKKNSVLAMAGAVGVVWAIGAGAVWAVVLAGAVGCGMVAGGREGIWHRAGAGAVGPPRAVGTVVGGAWAGTAGVGAGAADGNGGGTGRYIKMEVFIQ